MRHQSRELYYRNGDHHTLAQYIGLCIKQLRKDCDMTQLDIAQALGIKHPNISNIESGKQNITIPILEGLCEIFQCSSKEIIPF